MVHSFSLYLINLSLLTDLRHVLKLQPGNTEALAELLSIMPSAVAGLDELGVSPTDIPSNLASISRVINGKINGHRAQGSRDSSSGSRYKDDPPGDSHDQHEQHTNGSNSGSSASSSSSSSTAYTSYSSHSKSPSASSSTITPTSNGGSSSAPPNTDDVPPFELHPIDRCKLRFTTMPVQVEMPALGSGSNKKKGKVTASKGGAAAYDVQVETYSYPAWERIKVVKG